MNKTIINVEFHTVAFQTNQAYNDLLLFLGESTRVAVPINNKELKYFSMRSLRYLAVGKLIRRSIRAEDFLEFGVELEDLKIYGSTIERIESSAFEHVRSIKTLDLSENNIDFIDPFAFAEVRLM